MAKLTIAQPSVGRPDLDVDREARLRVVKGTATTRRDRPLVERVRRDDEHGSLAGLLAPSGWLEIGEPDLTAANGPHRSSSPSASVASHSARSASSSSQATGSAWSLA